MQTIATSEDNFTLISHSTLKPGLALETTQTKNWWFDGGGGGVGWGGVGVLRNETSTQPYIKVSQDVMLSIHYNT